MRELISIDAEIGPRLNFSTEGLAKRHRERCRVQTFAAEWASLKDDLPRIDAG